MIKNKTIFTLIIIFIIALAPRLFLAFNSCEVPTHDAGGYDIYAVTILESKGFGGIQNSYREPLYPLFLAFIYWLFGHNYIWVRIIQSFLGALVCIIIFIISKKLFSYKSALIAGLIACFNPSFIKITEHLLSENLYLFLLLVAIYFLVSYLQEKNYRDLIFSGLALGLLTLARAVIFFFPLFILLFIGKKLVRESYSFKKHVFAATLFLFFFILPILPWTIRNWRLHHRFIIITSKTGLDLYSSYVPKEGKLFGFTSDDAITKKAWLMKSEVEGDTFLFRETLKYIKKYPLRILRLEILKVVYFWSIFDWEIIGYGVYNFMFGFILPFFIYAIFVTWRRIGEFFLVYLPIIYSFLMALVTYGSPRFRLPIEPYIIIIAGVGIAYFLKSTYHRIYFILGATGYFCLNLFFYINSYQVKIFTRNIFEKIGLW